MTQISNLPESNIEIFNKLIESEIVPTDYYNISISNYDIAFQGNFCNLKVRRIESAIQRLTQETGLLGYEGKFLLDEVTRSAIATFPYHKLKIRIILT